MATTTARKRPTRPMSYYWDVVKDMDDSQKIELIAILAESIKPAAAKDMEANSEDEPLPRYTLKEMNALLDEAEANFAAGKGIPHEEVMREMDEEIERWEQEEIDNSRLPKQELEMAEVV